MKIIAETNAKEVEKECDDGMKESSDLEELNEYESSSIIK